MFNKSFFYSVYIGMNFFIFQKELLRRYIDASYLETDVDALLLGELNRIPFGSFDALYSLREHAYWERAKRMRYKRTLTFHVKRSNHKSMTNLEGLIKNEHGT